MCTLMCTESFEYCEEQRLMECFKQCEVALRQSNRLNRIPKHFFNSSSPTTLKFQVYFCTKLFIIRVANPAKAHKCWLNTKN